MPQRSRGLLAPIPLTHEGQTAGIPVDRNAPFFQELKSQVHKDIAERVNLLRTHILTIIGTLELLPGRLVRLGLEATVPATIEAEAHRAELLSELSALEQIWVSAPAEEQQAGWST